MKNEILALYYNLNYFHSKVGNLLHTPDQDSNKKILHIKKNKQTKNKLTLDLPSNLQICSSLIRLSYLYICLRNMLANLSRSNFDFQRKKKQKGITRYRNTENYLLI